MQKFLLTQGENNNKNMGGQIPLHMQCMSVVGKSTCSGFLTGSYISYHGGNAVRYIKQRGYFLKNGRIPGYFDTKYMKVLRIEQILHSFEDQKIANFLYLEQVDFRVTLIALQRQLN